MRHGDIVFLPDYGVYGLVVQYNYQHSKVRYAHNGITYSVIMSNEDFIEINEDDDQE